LFADIYTVLPVLRIFACLHVVILLTRGGEEGGRGGDEGTSGIQIQVFWDDTVYTGTYLRTVQGSLPYPTSG
jgi:hypothetical protein